MRYVWMCLYECQLVLDSKDTAGTLETCMRKFRNDEKLPDPSVYVAIYIYIHLKFIYTKHTNTYTYTFNYIQCDNVLDKVR